MKPVPLGSLPPGTLCHFVEPMGEETRIHFWKLEKRRKKKPSEDGKGRTIVPVMAYGIVQGVKAAKTLEGRANRFHADKPAHFYVDARYLVVKKTAKNWRPRRKP